MAMECPSGVTKTHINIEPFVFFRRVMFHSMISFLFGRDSKAHDPSILRKWEESSNLFRRAIQVSMLLPSFASQVHFARAARSRSELMTLLKPAICEQLNTKDDENFVKNALKYYTGSGTEVSEEELAEIAVKVIGLGTNGPTAVVANTLLELSKEKNAAFLDELVAECKPDPSQGFFSQSYLDSLKHLSSCIGETLRVTWFVVP
jgi:cytochrome P450